MKKNKVADSGFDEYLISQKPGCVLCYLDRMHKGDQQDIIKLGTVVNKVHQKLKRPWRWPARPQLTDFIYWSDPGYTIVIPGEKDRKFFIDHCEFLINKKNKNSYIFELIFDWKTGNYIILTGYRSKNREVHLTFNFCPLARESFRRPSKPFNKDINYLKNVLGL